MGRLLSLLSIAIAWLTIAVPAVEAGPRKAVTVTNTTNGQPVVVRIRREVRS